MSVLLLLGMTLSEVIAAVTWNPARAIHIDDRAGSLRTGMPADITVCQIESGHFEFADTEGRMRDATQRIVPTMVFKRGVRHPIDLTRCQDESNWLLQIAENHLPSGIERLGSRELGFLADLRKVLAPVEWVYDLANLDLRKAHQLRALFDSVRVRHGLPLRDALLAVYAPFLDSPFTMQIGLFLLHLERDFFLSRLDAVVSQAAELTP